MLVEVAVDTRFPSALDILLPYLITLLLFVVYGHNTLLYIGVLKGLYILYTSTS